MDRVGIGINVGAKQRAVGGWAGGGSVRAGAGAGAGRGRW